MLINKKIWLLVAIAMLTCAAVSGFGLYGVKRVNASVVDIAHNSVPALLLVSEMRSSYLSVIPQVYNRANTADAAQGEEQYKEIEAVANTLIKQVNDYTQRATDDDEKKALYEVTLNMVSFVTKLRQIHNLANTGETALALGIVQSDIGTGKNQYGQSGFRCCFGRKQLSTYIYHYHRGGCDRCGRRRRDGLRVWPFDNRPAGQNATGDYPNCKPA